MVVAFILKAMRGRLSYCKWKKKILLVMSLRFMHQDFVQLSFKMFIHGYLIFDDRERTKTGIRTNLIFPHFQPHFAHFIV